MHLESPSEMWLIRESALQRDLLQGHAGCRQKARGARYLALAYKHMRADADRVAESTGEMEFAGLRYSCQFFESERTADIAFDVIDDSSDTSWQEYLGKGPCIRRLPQPCSNQSSQDSLASKLKIKLVSRKTQG
jgi:hypothetical protein